jgi:hypothetical protein
MRASSVNMTGKCLSRPAAGATGGHACHRVPPLLPILERVDLSRLHAASWRARTQDADARQGLVSTTSRAQAVVQNFHLGSNVIPAEMRGCVLASGFSHLSGEDKVSGQQADG